MSELPTKAERSGTRDHRSDLEHRILVCGPVEPALLDRCRALSITEFSVTRCRDIDRFCEELRRGAAVAMLAAEALTDEVQRLISQIANRQSILSRIPLIVLTDNGDRLPEAWLDLRRLGTKVQLTLLERPLQAATLASLISAAVQAREAQHEVREELSARSKVEQQLRDSKEALKQANETLEQEVMKRTSVLQLMYDITSMANIASNVETAIVYVLKRVSEHNGWICGRLWLPSNDAPHLLRIGYDWYADTTSEIAELRRHATSRCVKVGEGPVGHVFANGVTVFTSDIKSYLAAGEVDPAALIGIRTVGAFPILAGEETVGVMEFLATKKIDVAATMSAYIATVGTQIGRVIERAAADAVLNKHKERLDLALAASDLGMWDIDLTTGEMMVDRRGWAMLGLSPHDFEATLAAWESLIHPDDLARVRQARAHHLAGHTESYEVEYRLRTGSGHWKWIRTRGRVASRGRDGEPLRLIGTHRDISERKKLEREIVETGVAEQRRLGRELHDGVGGDLTGIGFTLQGLIHDLQGTAECETAVKIGQELDRVIEQVRLLSHGLTPVGTDRKGLAVALEKLAERTTQIYGVDCHCDLDGTVHIDDSLVADHLYRIAQEAVTNAVKHADPQHVRITLGALNDSIVLQVRDDGLGISKQQLTEDGIGLRNIRYRAGLIGASLRIEPGEDSGTVVRCDYTSEQA